MVRRGGGDDRHGADGQSSSTHVRISSKMDNVVTILFQNRASAFFTGRLDLSKINFKSNIGDVIELLVDKVGLKASPSGKSLWWTAQPNEAPPPPTHRRPRPRRPAGRRARSRHGAAACRGRRTSPTRRSAALVATRSSWVSWRKTACSATRAASPSPAVVGSRAARHAILIGASTAIIHSPYYPPALRRSERQLALWHGRSTRPVRMGALVSPPLCSCLAATQDNP